MEGEAARRNLYEAATTGKVARFIQLLEQDPYLVHVASFSCSRNILHIATMHGQADIVAEITERHPQLARELDSQKSSPLHIAAEKTNVKIVANLLAIAPQMCWQRDGQGMNPFHVAAMYGDVKVLEELFRFSSLPAMERLHRGQTVLHLCVKQADVRALELLANRFRELVYATDDDGETILHSAVRCNNHKIVRHLVENKIIAKLTTNSTGKTPLDILEEISTTYRYDNSEMKKILSKLSKEEQPLLETLPKLTDMTMVVAVLIATMAFQAAVSPPGGVWQDDTSSHRAGKTVIASTHPQIYGHFVRANTTAFLSSLLTIFLITTQLPSKNYLYLLISMAAAWASLASISVSYGASVVVLSPHTEKKSLYSIIITAVVSLCIICLSPLVYHLYQSIKTVIALVIYLFNPPSTS